MQRRPSSGLRPPSPRTRGEGLSRHTLVECPSPRLRGEGGAKRRVRGVLIALFVLASAAAYAQTPDDLQLVNCRLPNKIKRVGGRTYTVSSPPIRTTENVCRIRGGEYTVYDRSNYANSLKFWLAEAEKGNVEAQYYVGKIYEGVLGTEPDYASAASWYQKAADKGHSPSSFSLASLYEKGLGVPADPAKAFNLYRQATGLPGNFVFVETSKYEELQKAAEDLALREEQIDELQRQLDDAKKQLKRDEKHERELQQQLEDERRKSEAQKQEVARIRTVAITPMTPIVLPAPKKGTLGRYYALVIGNSRYDSMPGVPSAEQNARAMEAVLRDKYGFQTTLLVNATRVKVLSALYTLSQNLAENDNLVVYYAGHGKRDLRNRRGWWLPVDAAADNSAKTNWLPNQEVSDRLALIPARHILVLADASYVGDITRGTPQVEPQKMTPAQWKTYVETTARKRARLALASGTDETGQSRFTATLIDVLEKQKGVFPASRIHREVVNALTSGAVTSAVPTFAPLQSAFHDGVDFLFERR